MTRFDNFTALYRMLLGQDADITWHLIIAHLFLPKISDGPLQVRYYDRPSGFAERINWFTSLAVPGEYYLVLNDDDFYEPGFFAKLDKVLDSDMAICSMKRGDRTPYPYHPNPAQRHPSNTLIAHPSNMTPGAVGIEQAIMDGSVFSKFKLGNDAWADGQEIMRLVSAVGAQYIPDAYVWFNYLEAGRWDK